MASVSPSDVSSPAPSIGRARFRRRPPSAKVQAERKAWAAEWSARMKAEAAKLKRT